MVELCKPFLSSAVTKKRGGSLLDVGCGDGVLLYMLKKKFQTIESYGIDYSDLAIKLAGEKIKSKGLAVSLQHGSAYEIPYEDGFFDVVVSSDVIEHLSDTNKYLNEICRVLKVGATAIISTPIRLTEHPEDKFHCYEWFQDEFKTVIKEQFPESNFVYSHSCFLKSLNDCKVFGSRYGKKIINLVSLVKNPFFGFNPPCGYPTLQYAICIKQA